MRSKIERGIKFEHHTKSANVHIKFFNLLFPSFIGPVTSSYLTLLYKKYMLKSPKFLSGMLFFCKSEYLQSNWAKNEWNEWKIFKLNEISKMNENVYRRASNSNPGKDDKICQEFREKFPRQVTYYCSYAPSNLHKCSVWIEM